MKISLKWLKDYVAPGVSAEKLAHKLTMAGMEVEKIFAEAGDTVMELEITPNRPDCLNVLGLARETAAIFNKPLKHPAIKLKAFPKKKCDITIEDAEDCGRYIGTLVNDVQVAAAPAMMTERLAAIGVRAVNNVVDITNFCLQETGQPLHAFDYDKLIGGKIIVRRAKKGEKITTIDGVERELDPSILVIADAKRPVAIAGVMGGLDTEVSGATKNVLLESAYFDPLLIRRAARKLGLTSDSSYRFERGVDPATVENGCNRALTLILDHAKGTIAARSDCFPGKRQAKRKTVTVKLSYINGLLGAKLTKTECRRILKSLSFQVAGEGDVLKVTPPSARGDIHDPVDVVEEVGRIIGYDNLPSSLPQVKMTNISLTNLRPAKQQLRRHLVGMGLSEVITFTLTSRAGLKKAGLEDLAGVGIQNPLSQDQDIMRPAMLPSLLNIVRTNLNRGQRDLRLYELGKIYPAKGEQEALAVLLTGTQASDWRQAKKGTVDFYDLKGVVDQIARRANVKGWQVVPGEHQSFVAGQTAQVLAGKTVLGTMGQVKPEILQGWDIKHTEVFFAELLLTPLLTKTGEIVAYQAPSEYPAVTRDISLAVKKTVRFQDLQQYVSGQGQGLLTEVRFLEQYLGDKIPAGSRGLIFSLTYQAKNRTLTEAEVQAAHDQILKGLVENYEATIR